MKKFVSEEIKRQTDLVWEYLEKVKPLITYIKLVPVAEQQIIEFEKCYDKIVPQDYRYWLTRYGSGRIEFIEGALEFLSIDELAEGADRLVDEDDPANCWKRPYIDYGGAPITSALDSTIIDESGCAPVIKTGVYSNEVGEVLSSSWPMYVLLELIQCALNLCQKGSNELSDEQLVVARDLAELSFKSIDVNLQEAKTRVEAHNETVIADGDEPSSCLAPNGIGNMVKLLNEFENNSAEDGPFAKLKSKFDTFLMPDKKFVEAVTDLERKISCGYSSLYSSFLENEVDLSHEQAMNVLLSHDRCEVRNIAKKGLMRINPALAEEQAVRVLDWLECAENWLLLRKDDKASLRCLKKAETMAEDIRDWLRCAEFWMEHFKRKEESARCLHEAERHASDTDDYLSITGSWVELDEDEIAKRCLRQAEDVCRGSEDIRALTWVADSWFENFSDNESAIRCQEKAEKLINHPSEWGYCAQSWKKLGNVQELQRCQKNEQK